MTNETIFRRYLQHMRLSVDEVRSKQRTERDTVIFYRVAKLILHYHFIRSTIITARLTRGRPLSLLDEGEEPIVEIFNNTQTEGFH